MSSSFPCRHDKDDRAIVLRTMRALENSVYKRPSAHSMPEMFRGLWRRQIVEWMYVLIKYCKLRHEATAAAVYYLDAAVMCESSSLVNSPRDYQLCAMTALHLALKVYDSPTMRVVKLSCLVKLGNGEFTEQDIIQKEQHLVEALGWRINPPTADCFLQRYMELLPFVDDDDEECEHQPIDESDPSSMKHKEDNDQLGPMERRRRERLQKLEEVASEFIEVAMARDCFLSVKPSVIAYAALLSAMELTSAKKQQKCCYDWSTFLCNMTEIAEMDDILGNVGGDRCGGKASRSVRRTKMLLDRIVKGLSLPPEEQYEDFLGAAGSETNTRFSEKTDSNQKNDENNNLGECTKISAMRSTSPRSPISTVSSVNTASLA